MKRIAILLLVLAGSVGCDQASKRVAIATLEHGGTVVDFLNVGLGSLRTGIFNVADVAIFAGIGVLLWAGRKAAPNGPSTPLGMSGR